MAILFMVLIVVWSYIIYKQKIKMIHYANRYFHKAYQSTQEIEWVAGSTETFFALLLHTHLSVNIVGEIGLVLLVSIHLCCMLRCPEFTHVQLKKERRKSVQMRWFSMTVSQKSQILFYIYLLIDDRHNSSIILSG